MTHMKVSTDFSLKDISRNLTLVTSERDKLILDIQKVRIFSIYLF
jgi:hypothetical protein